MKVCPKCHGTGEVPIPNSFWVQLRELDRWGDYLDFKTKEEAIKCAVGTRWGSKARIRRGRTIVWHGVDDGTLQRADASRR